MFDRFLFVPLLLGSLMACTPQIAGDSPSARSVTQATPATPVTQSSTAPAKTTIQVNGKPQTVPLGFVQKRYLSIYYPMDRFVLDKSSKTSDSVAFFWKKPDGTLDREAWVGFIFFPKDDKLRDVQEMSDAFTGAAAGAHGVQIVKRSPAISYAKKAYSAWLRDVTRFEFGTSLNSADPRNGVRTNYYGEVNGKVFVVGSSYAPQDGDEFTSREDVILKNLKVRKQN